MRSSIVHRPYTLSQDPPSPQLNMSVMRRLFVLTILFAAFTLPGCMLNMPVQQAPETATEEAVTAEDPTASESTEDAELHQFNLFRFLMSSQAEASDINPAEEIIDIPASEPEETAQPEGRDSGPNPFSLMVSILSQPPTDYSTKPATSAAEKGTAPDPESAAQTAQGEETSVSVPAPEAPAAETALQPEPPTRERAPAREEKEVVAAPAVNPLEHFAAVPTPSLWQHMRKGFQLALPDDEPRLKKEITWLEKNPHYIQKIRERAHPYLYFIVKEIESRGMPMELALLPAVESAYRPFAYSHGRAAGLWQFIPSTGKRFGLQQNWWYDGRRDVVASTRAALNYLRKLNLQFDGDWELTLAAYNAGSGNVRKAIRNNRAKGKPTDYWSLDLPPETRRYIPRLLALSSIIRHPVKHKAQLGFIPNKPHFDTIGIGSQLDLALAAEMAGISVDELYRLNPGLNRWATPPDGPHRLSIPAHRVKSFQAKLADLSPEQRVQWQRYKIQPGDTLSVIAQKHSTTTRILRQVNKITGNQIRAGKYLLIPTASKNLSQYALSAEERTKKTLSRQLDGIRKEHVVREGENFWDIARLYQVNYRSLAKWNGMAPRDTLRTGQKLVVWLPETEENRRIAAPLELRPPTGKSSIHYRVREGDSLSTIANRFQVKVDDLRRWNTLSGKYLKPGQKLVLYVDVTEQTL